MSYKFEVAKKLGLDLDENADYNIIVKVHIAGKASSKNFHIEAEEKSKIADKGLLVRKERKNKSYTYLVPDSKIYSDKDIVELTEKSLKTMEKLSDCLKKFDIIDNDYRIRTDIQISGLEDNGTWVFQEFNLGTYFTNKKPYFLTVYLPIYPNLDNLGIEDGYVKESEGLPEGLIETPKVMNKRYVAAPGTKHKNISESIIYSYDDLPQWVCGETRESKNIRRNVFGAAMESVNIIYTRILDDLKNGKGPYNGYIQERFKLN